MSAEPRTLADVGRLVASKALTSEAVTERCLERITEQNRTLNAFVSVLDDDAVAQAKEADQEIAAGRYRGPLHGIPISLKDIIELFLDTGLGRGAYSFVSQSEIDAGKTVAKAEDAVTEPGPTTTRKPASKSAPAAVRSIH